jgi:hypothetical protein
MKFHERLSAFWQYIIQRTGYQEEFLKHQGRNEIIRSVKMPFHSVIIPVHSLYIVDNERTIYF